MSNIDKIHFDHDLQFRDLSVGDKFDFVDPNAQNSFFLTCEKISQRRYCDSNNVEHTVGTVYCNVFHVERRKK